jgi:hypothetical protein
MYVSRLSFHTRPGRTGEVEKELRKLLKLVSDVGGIRPRVLRTHLASEGAPDLVFEQEAPDIGVLENQIRQVTDSSDFQNWSRHVSELVADSPKREIYLVVE